MTGFAARRGRSGPPRTEPAAAAVDRAFGPAGGRRGRGKGGRGKPRPYGRGCARRGEASLARVGAFVRTATVALVLLTFFLASLQPGNAAGELHHAGLVVREGDGTLTYAYVAFPEASISGIELLRRSGLPLVTAGFGGLGEGVCAIGDQGCGLTECRRRLCQGPGQDAPYWRYFRQQAPGDWRPLDVGASATRVVDGDIDGWSWTAGDPGLPALSLEEIARLVGAADAAATAGNGPVPTPAVRVVRPGGAAPGAAPPGLGWTEAAGAAAILAAIAATGVYAARRRALRSGAAP